MPPPVFPRVSSVIRCGQVRSSHNSRLWQVMGRTARADKRSRKPQQKRG